MKKIAFYTLGCRANQYQTEIIKNKLTTNNLQLTTFSDVADIYVINTCTVTEDADRTSRQAIRRALRQNPNARVIVTGCYARLEGETLKGLFTGIEVAVSLPASFTFTSPLIRSNLMIQDGCEHFCSYCIVPYARGKFQSKTPEDVISEAKRMVAAGAKEIVLTGINLGAYQYSLPDLLTRLSALDGLLRLRLSSIEPMYLTKELIDAIARTPKACRSLHLPLQSGDDDILKAMQRSYSRDDYLALIEYIRDRMPECGISADVIVGFPGEGEKEFKNTVNLLDQIKLSRMHIFPYSKRKGTRAAELPNHVSAKVKKERLKVLEQIRTEHMRTLAENYLDREVEVLVENIGVGLTSNFIRVLYPGNESEVGTLKMLRIKEVKDEYCLA